MSMVRQSYPIISHRARALRLFEQVSFLLLLGICCKILRCYGYTASNG
ncbi:unnamed protein product [Fusarium venenatum]|uniref:Uncharacterized protein n=1 Tax=Fusarium venenatum TaxID=56646 RepID=A0A2L2SYI9_9HYPO|nr:uncharacterized protein FVRRES_11254 [Fusarium venenatum]CEI38563.1 unnamed protein product [Fusarium venenatum]